MIDSRVSMLAAVLAGVCWAAPATHAQFIFDGPTVFSFSFNIGTTAVGIGHLDADGLLDAVVAGRNLEGLAVVMKGSAADIFGPAMELDIGAQTDWVIIERLDGDAHLDAAFSLRTGVGKVAVLEGSGDGSFGNRVDYPVGRGPTQILARDFDGDQDIDLAVNNWALETISVLRNDGNGVFTPTGQVNHIGRLTRGRAGGFYFTAADFDRDRDIDIAVAKSSGFVAVLANNGDGTFGRPVDYKAGTAIGIAAGDIDDDGDIDIVFADLTISAPAFLGVLHNQGNGVFTGPTKFPIQGSTLWYLDLADLNGDDLLDVMITDALGQKLFLIENQTVDQQLSFGEPQSIGIGGFGRSLLAVDLDEDCDLDIVIANIGAHTVLVFMNETPQAEPCRNQARLLERDKAPAPRRSGFNPLRGRRRNSQERVPIRISDLTDLNRDGKVDAQDLAAALAEWR